MAATVTPRGTGPVKNTPGERRMVTGTMNVGTHASGGVAVTAAMFNLATLEMVIFGQETNAARSYAYNPGTGKVIATTIDAGAAIGTVDLSTDVVPFVAFGY